MFVPSTVNLVSYFMYADKIFFSRAFQEVAKAKNLEPSNLESP